MQKIIIFFVIMAATNAMASDFQKIKEFGFSDEHVAKLVGFERLENFTNTETNIYLMPQTVLTDKMRTTIILKKPTTVVEALYYLPKGSTSSQQIIYNKLLQLSTLSGLEYYSRREKKSKVLINSVTMIAGIGSSELLPDPSISIVPAEQRYYIRQDDETFGLADYEALFLADNKTGELGISLTNSSTLKKSGIKMGDPYDMETLLIMIPMEEGNLLYSIITNKKSPPSFVRKTMNESLLNRLDAFKNWFISRLL